MFTGIIEEIGTVKSIKKSGKSMILEINAKNILKNAKIGDSIATNGVCLTITDFNKNFYSADIMPETYNRSNLKNLKINDKVNLESAMTIDKKFGGHVVQGHIDGTGIIKDIKKSENAHIFTIETEEKLMRYIIEKGSIALDGISLTIVFANNSIFGVSLIPETKSKTTLFEKQIGDEINIECDILGKYFEHFYNLDKKETKNDSNITESMLKNNGFF